MKRMFPSEYPPFYNKVMLVERNPEPDGVQLVNVNRVAKKDSHNLVALAENIQRANTAVYANACNKLQIIGEQIKFLQYQAEGVLREIQVNQDLHNAACNFIKVPGQVYHLYKRPSGQTYMGMISPKEWVRCPHEFLGSFRLESDQSWTPEDSLATVDARLAVIDSFIQRGETKGNMFCLENSSMESCHVSMES